jgi:hypothetical protein
LPAKHIHAGLAAMGAKYLPTVRDLKGSQRFQQQQAVLAKIKKAATDLAAKKEKKR